MSERQDLSQELEWLEPMRTALDLASDGALFVEPGDLGIVEVNQSACASLGYDRDALLALSLVRIAPEAAEGSLAAAVERVLQGDDEVAVAQTFFQRRDGSRYPVESLVRSVATPAGQRIVVVSRDLTGRNQSDDPAGPAHSDAVTGLPTRAIFERRLWQALDRVQRCARPCAVYFIDVDHFKRVNDTLGHAAGDRVLQAVAERLASCVRPGDLVARYGGDEFTVLVGDVQHEPEAIRIAERMQGVLGQAVDCDGQQITVTASIGIALSRAGYVTVRELVEAADRAMYQAKARGRSGQFVLHEHSSEGRPLPR